MLIQYVLVQVSPFYLPFTAELKELRALRMVLKECQGFFHLLGKENILESQVLWLNLEQGGDEDSLTTW